MDRTRADALARVVTPLPGSIPYVNRRPLTVAGRYDGWTLEAWLADRHPHIARAVWAASVAERRLEVDGRVASSLATPVRAGCRVVHSMPGTVEPPVHPGIEFLHEDEALLVLGKPAPLPVHPSGRFHKNTLTALLALACPDLDLRLVHRLDADTTGVMVLAKTRAAARSLAAQFEQGRVHKEYLAWVEGVTPLSFARRDPVARHPHALGRRAVGPQGRAAETRCERLRADDGRSLLLVRPQSGRTNQIRVHLAAAGYPIVGDAAYGGGPARPEVLTTASGGLCLHAWRLGFDHPSGERRTFVAAPPTWAGGMDDPRPDAAGSSVAVELSPRPR